MYPNFFIVGAAKAGTSSLDRYLSQHPQIYIPPKKEAHYFSIPDFPLRFTGPGDDGMNEFTIRDKETYTSLFTPAENHLAVGESSVFYLYYPGTAERIYQEVPAAKIIIVLRNPVDRAFSAYMHLIRDERETLTFEASLEQEPARRNAHFEPMWLYKALGLYASQVERYLATFGHQQVKVVLFEEFVRNPQATLEELFAFLQVDPFFEVDTSLRLNESGKPKSRLVYNFVSQPHPLKELLKPLIPHQVRERMGIRAKSLVLERTEMNPETRRNLQAFFLKDTLRLESILHRDLSIWYDHAETDDGLPQEA